jgi:biopolymer transport protein ExbD
MRYRARAKGDPAQLDITAFMNLMVILVPFLLITAVFSRIAVLDLSLPHAAPDKSITRQQLELEVILRSDGIEVGDRRRGHIKQIPNRQGQRDLKVLSQLLQQLKAHYPAISEAMILAEPTTPYDALVQVMDTVRVVQRREGSAIVQSELFPNISIGDAPVAMAANAGPR